VLLVCWRRKLEQQREGQGASQRSLRRQPAQEGNAAGAWRREVGRQRWTKKRGPGPTFKHVGLNESTLPTPTTAHFPARTPSPFHSSSLRPAWQA
jgi:uncharacterized protein YgiB involved in biofilm formation